MYISAGQDPAYSHTVCGTGVIVEDQHSVTVSILAIRHWISDFRPFSLYTTGSDYTFARKRKSESLCITSSLESTSCLIPPLVQNTLLMMSQSLIHLPPAHHSHPPSHIHCFIPGSKLTFSTHLFHQSLLAPTWTAFSETRTILDRT